MKAQSIRALHRHRHVFDPTPPPASSDTRYRFISLFPRSVPRESIRNPCIVSGARTRTYVGALFAARAHYARDLYWLIHFYRPYLIGPRTIIGMLRREPK
ncbi:hypothetical protein EVAR_47286_1 [Eumeta japonica]|uniref:Uncharacterized protein n=1 Tax=Eumeta variegata TaxID=151549 RepID=A0A4C1YZW4_EUMVA|nr:hypothetical protein EVAR_47286_1 [Eumeta japonica]